MDVSDRDVAMYLRMGGMLPDGALAARIAELKDVVRGVLRPKRTFRRVPVGEVPMRGSTLARHLSDCREAYLVCASLGTGMDSLQRRLSVRSAADALIVQALGAAFMEALMDETEDEIRAELRSGERLVLRYSPGYGDWPLSVQRDLLRLLDAPLKVGVSLTDSYLMVPSKSVSAVIGVLTDGAGKGKGDGETKNARA